MQSSVSYSLLIAAAFLAGLPAGSPSQGLPRGSGDSRAAIEARASEAERLSSLDSVPKAERDRESAYARVLRDRLKYGDFHAGDLLDLRIPTDTTLNRQYTIQAGDSLVLGNLGALSLSGVLRSEAVDRITQFLGRFYTDPRVTATPLIKVWVTGRVARQGSTTIAPDKSIADVIEAAGGLAADADPTKVSLRRNGTEIRSADELKNDVTESVSLDVLGITSGDELMIGQRTTRTFSSTMQIVTGVTTLLLSIYGLSRLR